MNNGGNDPREPRDQGTPADQGPPSPSGDRWRVSVLHLLWAFIIAGVVLRILTFWTGFVFWDSPYYVQMGRTFSDGSNFQLPWGDPFTSSGGGYAPGPSHHFSPLYPMYLGTTYTLLGYSLEVTRAAAIFLSLLALVVIHRTSRDLLGPDKALALTALFSLDPILVTATRDLMPENMIMALFVLTIWAIVRAIKDDRYMVIAAIAAGAGYLTKASVGYLFIVAGAGGFAWRFYYLRWDVFRRRYYLGAIAIFLGLVLAWSLRNIWLFGWPHWETSPYLQDALGGALGNLGEVALNLLVTAPIFVAILMLYGAFWLPWVRRSLARVREERTSALWLAVGLVFVITLIFSAALAVYEDSDLMTHAALRLRYLVIAFPPMMWAVMDEVDLPSLRAPLGIGALRASVGEAWRTARSLRRSPRRTAAIAALLVAGPSLLLLGHEYLVVSAMLVVGAMSLLLEDPRKVLIVMLAVFFVASLELATERAEVPEIELARALDDRLGTGDVVAMDGGHVNIGYLYLGLEDFDFDMRAYHTGDTPDYIISYLPGEEYPGYGLVGVYIAEESPGVVKQATLGLLPDSAPLEGHSVALWERL